jgi:Pyridoxamine 5'-phosphate oxidase
MRIDGQVSEVLERTMVVEFATITPKGALSTRPVGAVWLPERNQIVLTTPVAYPQKVFNIRRDSRVALLYSDPTGSGLTDPPAVLVQGHATAPHPVASPDEVPDYWRGILTKFPWVVQELESEQFRSTMDWFYWRIPIYVTPERVRVLPRCEVGGATEPPLPQPSAPLAARVRDALERYPTGVLTGRDDHGWPYAVRGTVTAATDGNSYLVKPVESVPGGSEPASLLWHRHGGRATRQLSELLVIGTVSTGVEKLVFIPERTFTGGLTFDDNWLERNRKNSLNYLQKRNVDPPQINWQNFLNYAAP